MLAVVLVPSIHTPLFLLKDTFYFYFHEKIVGA